METTCLNCMEMERQRNQARKDIGRARFRADKDLQYMRGQLQDLRAENEALRKDAERWRYFRMHSTWYWQETFEGDLSLRYRRWYHDSAHSELDTLDAAIDAARGGKDESTR